MVDMIGVTIKLPLNIRKGPGTNYGLIGEASPSGKVILMEGVEDGENYKGVNKWYYKFNDKQEKQWYWGGRISLVNTFASTDPLIAPPITDIKSDLRNYINHLNLPWLKSEGEDTLIVVIDTGVSVLKTGFNKALIQEEECSENQDPDRDHGTFIAGILAATGGEVRGIATQANLLCLRMSDTVTGRQKLILNCNEALNKVIKKKSTNPHLRIIINLSQGFNISYQKEFPAELKTMAGLIKQLADLQVPIFCAAGEDGFLLEENLIFPANMAETIAVGCIKTPAKTSGFSNKIKLITPLQFYLSFDSRHTVIPNRGSSFSTPIIVALAACYYSGKTIFSKEDFFNELYPFNTQIADFNFTVAKYQFFFNS